MCYFYEMRVFVMLHIYRQRFVDICEKRVDSLVLTVAKDPSLKKKGLKGEFVVSKVGYKKC